jgi:sugar phosphate isomerase/epimerase
MARVRLKEAVNLAKRNDFFAAEQEILDVENGDAELIGELFDRYSFAELGFCFDSGHSHMAGNLSALEAFASRLVVVHLHDNHGDQDEHDLPGTGTLDWPRVRRFLQRAPNLRTLNLEVVQRSEEDHLAWAQRAYACWEEHVAGVKAPGS